MTKDHTKEKENKMKALIAIFTLASLCAAGWKLIKG